MRLLVDGSFVTAKVYPNDVDAVVLLRSDFEGKIDRGDESALEPEAMLLTRNPEEIFAAEEDLEFAEWVEFFSRTREADGRRKGLVEVFAMITNTVEYEKAQEELYLLEERLQRLQGSHSVGAKGFTKAGIRKMIARLHEELALFEGSEEARAPELK